jgi:hypothetical protein
MGYGANPVPKQEIGINPYFSRIFGLFPNWKLPKWQTAEQNRLGKPQIFILLTVAGYAILKQPVWQHRP